MRLPCYPHVRGCYQAARRSLRAAGRTLALTATIGAGWSSHGSEPAGDVNLAACLSAAGYAEALLTRTSSGAWLAVATLDSHGVTVLVDPRAPYSFLDATTLKKLGYTLIPAKREVLLDGVREPLYRIRLSNFALGKRNADSLWFDVMRVETVARAAGLDSKTPVAGIIGGDMLRRSDALLDMEHDRLFLREIRPAADDSVQTTAPAKARGARLAGDTLLGDIERRLRRWENKQGGQHVAPTVRPPGQTQNQTGGDNTETPADDE